MFYVKNTGAYARTSTEAIYNAKQIGNILGRRGWSKSAICGVLGNIGYESGYNPFRWQGDQVLNSWDTSGITSNAHGYGLFQFTPASTYIYEQAAYTQPGFYPNFLDRPGHDTDGGAQLLFMDAHGGYIPTAMFPISFARYKANHETPEQSAAAWLYNFERPADPAATLAARQQEARYWWDTIQTPTKQGMPIYFYLRRRK